MGPDNELQLLPADQEHTHPGAPSYRAYVQFKCRADSCRSANTEYHRDLKSRQQHAAFTDLRRLENRRQPIAGQDLLRMIDAMMLSDLAPDLREALLGTGVTVLRVLAQYSDDSGRVAPAIADSYRVALLTGIDPDQIARAVRRLLKVGLLRKLANDVYIDLAVSSRPGLSSCSPAL